MTTRRTRRPSTAERFVLTVEAMPDQFDRTAEQRLKALLKHAGRACSLRCVHVSPVEPTNGTASSENAADAAQRPAKGNHRTVGGACPSGPTEIHR
ncbi:MAG: hypothetical protein KGY81_09440 [Phycisphaerae bacterium]|nr:hypothetical protein [Phycisphaerae bacterium]